MVEVRGVRREALLRQIRGRRPGWGAQRLGEPIAATNAVTITVTIYVTTAITNAITSTGTIAIAIPGPRPPGPQAPRLQAPGPRRFDYW